MAILPNIDRVGTRITGRVFKCGFRASSVAMATARRANGITAVCVILSAPVVDSAMSLAVLIYLEHAILLVLTSPPRCDMSQGLGKYEIKHMTFYR